MIFLGAAQQLAERLRRATEPDPGPRPAQVPIATASIPKPVPVPIVTDSGRTLQPLHKSGGGAFSGSGCGCGGSGSMAGFSSFPASPTPTASTATATPQLAPVSERRDIFASSGGAFAGLDPVPRVAPIERLHGTGPVALYLPGQVVGLRPPEVRPIPAFTTDAGRSSLASSLVVPTPPSGEGSIAGTQPTIERARLLPLIGAAALALLI